MAVAIVFFLNGVTFATWVSRIPDVRDRLALTPGQLGWVLLGLSAGSVLGLPTAGLVVRRLGARRTVAVAAGVCALGLVGAGAATTVLASVVVLTGCLFVVGFGMGQWDVAMNLHGAVVEQRLGRAVMPRFHAAFSLGTVAAALIGSAMAGWRLAIGWHFLVVGACMATLVVRGVVGFLPEAGTCPPAAAPGPAQAGAAAHDLVRDPGRRTRSAWTEPRTLGIGLVVLAAAFGEGTASDWLSVAMVDGYRLPSWAGVLVFTAFLLAMTAGRVVGTGLLDRCGRVRLLRVLFLTAGVGAALVVVGPLPLAVGGAVVWGVGVSLGFPVGMSAAADDVELAPARLAVVSTIGYTAFLAGPPLLGFLGDRVGVLRALSVMVVLLVLALWAVPSVGPPGSRPARAAGPSPVG